MLDSSTSIYTTEKSHYTYWITNTKLQKHYIGVRSSDIPPIHDIGIKYFSSSSEEDFKKDQKINPQDYEYRIIGVFPTKKEAYLNEIELHETYNVGVNLRFYNRANATSTGFSTSGIIPSEETRKKISEAQKNRAPYSKETRKKISDAHKNISEETRKKMSDSAKNRAPHSKETRKKISDAQIGKKRAPYSEETRKKMSEAQKNRAPRSEETRKKISDAQIGKKRAPYSKETRKKMSDSAKKKPPISLRS